MSTIFDDVIDRLRAGDESVDIPRNLPGDTELRFSVFDVSLYYRRDASKRGFYLIVRPVTVALQDGYEARTCNIMSARAVFVSPQPIARVSAKARRDALSNVTPELLEQLTSTE